MSQALEDIAKRRKETKCARCDKGADYLDYLIGLGDCNICQPCMFEMVKKVRAEEKWPLDKEGPQDATT